MSLMSCYLFFFMPPGPRCHPWGTSCLRVCTHVLGATKGFERGGTGGVKAEAVIPSLLVPSRRGNPRRDWTWRGRRFRCIPPAFFSHRSSSSNFFCPRRRSREEATLLPRPEALGLDLAVDAQLGNHRPRVWDLRELLREWSWGADCCRRGERLSLGRRGHGGCGQGGRL